MRASRLPHLPTLLLSVALAVMLHALAASAASGLPPTITMSPGQAGPGSEVEVLGLDFPAAVEVDLLLTTTAGPVALGTATTGEGGYFRQPVTFPAEIAPGFWELRATAPGGAIAVTIFEAEAPGAVAGVQGEAMVAAAAESLPSSGALIDPNLAVVLVLILLLVAVGGCATFVWYQTHRREGEPGMSTGDDPIWSGAGGHTQ
ncbi:hypothetical protein BH24CHL9_BH24CHL9_16110 [soil metagenome]